LIGGRLAAFLHHVSGIVSGRAKPQVIDSNTPSHIAAMENPHPSRDRAMRHLIGVAMRHDPAFPIVEPAVPTTRRSARPQPAGITISPSNLAPESLCHGAAWSIGSGTRRRAELASAIPKPGGFCSECSATCRTGDSDTMRAHQTLQFGATVGAGDTAPDHLDSCIKYSRRAA
jgi:hypothetical protein